jgi:hypothetical protein
MALSQSDKLLLYCLSAVQDETGDRRLNGLSSSDWDVLFEDSRRHGIASLLYYRLRTFHPRTPIPANVMERLRQIYLQCSCRNMQLYHELGNLMGTLRLDNIPVIALKGVHLATVVYRNVALRPMGDIDLLVKQSDLLRVQEILVKQGYIALKEEVGSAQEHLPPYKKKGSFTIEIHFHIVGPPFSLRVDVEKLWARAQMSSIQGIKVLTLCPEDLVPHLCMHASFHHGFDNGIRPLLDISHTIQHYAKEFDWEQLLNRSKEWGVGKCVYLSLFLAKKFAGAPIPEQIMKDLDVYDDSFAAATLAEELIFTKSTSVAPNIAMLFDNKNLLDRLIHFIRCAFPPKNTMADMHLLSRNPLSVYSLYSFRIKGLLKRHGHTAWRLLLRDREVSTYAKFENKRSALKDWLTRRT